MVVRLLRTLALLVGGGLIVAVLVLWFTRGQELERQRDRQLESTSQLATTELSAIVRTLTVAADVSGDPLVAAEALARANGLTMCAAVPDALDQPVCVTSTRGGAPTEVDDGAIGRAAELFAEPPESVVLPDADFVEIVVVGDELSLYAQTPLSRLARTGGVSLAIVADGDDAPDEPVTSDGVRVITMPIPGADDVALTASSDASVNLSDDEQVRLAGAGTFAIVLVGLALLSLRRDRNRLVERASIDPLTRLPNRSEFERRAEERIEEAEQSETGLCMLLLDLNGFKAINDTRGHQAGDEVLREMGARLRDTVRDYDVVARWGGDEFVLVLPGISDATAARTRATSIAETISSTEVGDGLRVGASIGIALYPRHGETLAELVEAADGAMYAAKRDGVTHRLAGVESAPLPVHIDAAHDRRHDAPHVR